MPRHPEQEENGDPMRRLIGLLVRRLAPRTMAGLSDLNTTREEFGELTATIRALEARVRELESAVADFQEEIDETRRDGRRVTEVYDLVFERLRTNS